MSSKVSFLLTQGFINTEKYAPPPLSQLNWSCKTTKCTEGAKNAKMFVRSIYSKVWANREKGQNINFGGEGVDMLFRIKKNAVPSIMA
jgi:hypothetical protein